MTVKKNITNLGDKFLEPILELFGRFDDRLPPWMVKGKRWIGVIALSAMIGVVLYLSISLFGGYIIR